MKIDQKLNPGTVISVPKLFINHLGLVTGNYWQGQPTVIANTPRYGKVVEQTIENFRDGSVYEVVFVPQDYLQGVQAVRKAYTLKNKPYNLFAFNCEHLINDAYEFKRHSPQLKQWSIGLLLSAGLLLTLTKTR